MKEYFGIISENFPSPPGAMKDYYKIVAEDDKIAFEALKQQRATHPDSRAHMASAYLFYLGDSTRQSESVLVEKLEHVKFDLMTG